MPDVQPNLSMCRVHRGHREMYGLLFAGAAEHRELLEDQEPVSRRSCAGRVFPPSTSMEREACYSCTSVYHFQDICSRILGEL